MVKVILSFVFDLKFIISAETNSQTGVGRSVHIVIWIKYIITRLVEKCSVHRPREDGLAMVKSWSRRVPGGV